MVEQPSVLFRRIRNKSKIKRRRLRPPTVDAVGSTYATRLGQQLAPLLELVEAHVLPLTAPDTRQDAASFETLIKTFGNFRVALFQRMLAGAELDAWRASKGVNTQNKAEYNRLLGVDVFKNEPWLRPLVSDWVAENVSLVRNMGENALSDLERTILSMVRDGESIKDIREEIRERFSVSTSRAKLIARDQVNKLNGRLTEERQTRLGVTQYVWRTSEDQRVRGVQNSNTRGPNHVRLNGHTFDWSNPPITNRNKGERNHPGGDIQCLPGVSKIEMFGDVEKLFRRRYSGKLTQLVMETGKAFYATPNHPILTVDGWVPVELIDSGDYVLEGLLQRSGVGKSNIKHFEIGIAEVFQLGCSISIGSVVNLDRPTSMTHNSGFSTST